MRNIEKNSTKAIVVALCAATVLYFGSIFNNNGNAVFEFPNIKAKSYSWPKGCEKEVYKLIRGRNKREVYFEKNRVSLPKECASADYRFHDRDRYGLIAGKGVGDYYRIDNDLVSMSCSVFGKCRVNHIYQDSFYQ